MSEDYDDNDIKLTCTGSDTALRKYCGDLYLSGNNSNVPSCDSSS